LIGGLARRFGNQARELDPEHRRDGLALLLLAASVIVASGVWLGGRNVVSHLALVVVAGVVGALAWAIPLLLAWFAWRLLRQPQDSAATGRVAVGSSALLISLVGLWHAELREISIFLLIIIVLALKPEGLLGQRQVEKV